jgi:hypothetical protein
LVLGHISVLSNTEAGRYETLTTPRPAGEAAVGKRVPMRTEIRIDDNDHHTIDLYFTPPGKSEVLATRAVYTRLGK